LAVNKLTGGIFYYSSRKRQNGKMGYENQVESYSFKRRRFIKIWL
jgi:hypothetical protein